MYRTRSKPVVAWKVKYYGIRYPDWIYYAIRAGDLVMKDNGILQRNVPNGSGVILEGDFIVLQTDKVLVMSTSNFVEDYESDN